jgi:hypothetical protein
LNHSALTSRIKEGNCPLFLVKIPRFKLVYLQTGLLRTFSSHHDFLWQCEPACP